MRLLSLYEDTSFVYRGMSNEEWDEATTRGYILSDCRFAPYKGQNNISCFGDYNTAVYYATELAIEKPEHIDWEWRGETARKKPYVGVVIEIPKNLMASSTEHPQIDKDEFWAMGKIPINLITQAWQFIPTPIGGEIQFKKFQILP